MTDSVEARAYLLEDEKQSLRGADGPHLGTPTLWVDDA
jgi:hypothetical protein